MKFSEYRCPQCACNDLDVISSEISEDEIAIGTITFQCKECYDIFYILMKAVIECQ